MPSPAASPSLSERILSRLERAEAREPNPHFQDDYRIAWITVLRCSRGELGAHTSATYAVLGVHPSKVWPAILERRKALLGPVVWEESFPTKKPSRSACSPISELPRAA